MKVTRETVALVTGGARRLGAAIATALAGDGARVAIHYHGSAGAAERLAGRLESDGLARPHLFAADLGDAVAAQELPSRVVDALGRLDVLVNSAGILVHQPFGSVTPDDWDRVQHVNLRAYFFVAQGAAPHLRRQRGTIVNISDIAARDPWPGFIPHCVSKAGVEMLTKGLARALAPAVRVNAIAPGAVLVPDDWDETRREAMARRTPLERLGDPEHVVQAVRFLVANEYTTGSTVTVDGGQLIQPHVSTLGGYDEPPNGSTDLT